MSVIRRKKKRQLHIDWLIGKSKKGNDGTWVQSVQSKRKALASYSIDGGGPWWDGGVMNGDDGVDQNVHERQ